MYVLVLKAAEAKAVFAPHQGTCFPLSFFSPIYYAHYRFQHQRIQQELVTSCLNAYLHGGSQEKAAGFEMIICRNALKPRGRSLHVYSTKAVPPRLAPCPVTVVHVILRLLCENKETTTIETCDAGFAISHSPTVIVLRGHCRWSLIMLFQTFIVVVTIRNSFTLFLFSN